MELTHLNQVDFHELRSERIDYIITSIGTQPRCFYLAEKFHTIATNKILLVTGTEENRKNGEKYLSFFSEYRFNNFKIEKEELTSFENLINKICNIKKHQVNIIIDYSCMPKRWYAMIIDIITRKYFPADRVNLYLAYTPKVFERNPGKHGIGYFGPINNNRDNLKDKKPVSLIASLDNNHNTIQEAINKIKPQKLLAFIPHCSHDPEYTRLVIETNKNLLGKLDNNCIINYEADRPEDINSLLTSYCLDERVDSEVMILPQGPKTFSMMSMLLSVRYPDVKLWEIILKDQKYSVDHGQPAANPVIVKVSFINDELD